MRRGVCFVLGASVRPLTVVRSRGLWLRWGVVTTILAVAAVVSVLVPEDRGVVDALKDMNGNPVRYEANSVPRPGAYAAPDGSGRFIAKSVQLDVPLGALNAVDGIVAPPGFNSAYLIRDYGVSPGHAAEGTVYVVMHSLRNGGVGPGNYLIDVDDGKARISIGEEISVDNVSYRVTGSDRVSKSSLPGSSIWLNTPGQLVVITCLQRPDNRPSTDNIIIRGQKIER